MSHLNAQRIQIQVRLVKTRLGDVKIKAAATALLPHQKI